MGTGTLRDRRTDPAIWDFLTGGRCARGSVGQRRGRLFGLGFSPFVPGNEQRNGYRSDDGAGQRRQVSNVTDRASGLGAGRILMPVRNADRQKEKRERGRA